MKEERYLLFKNFLITAVKFGRMSKKQREKVEDEVRFHKANQQRTGVSETSPDSSIYEPATPTSSDVYNSL